MTTATSDQGEAAEVAAALDMLLTQAALGPTRRFFPGKSSLRFAGGLARRRSDASMLEILTKLAR